MSVTMDDSIKRWTAKSEAVLVSKSYRARRRSQKPVGPTAFHRPRSRAGSITPSGARCAAGEPAGAPRAIREAAEGPAGGLRRSAAGVARPRKAGGLDRGAAGQALHLVRRSAVNDLLQADQGRAAGRSALCRSDQGDDRERAVVRLSHGGLAAGLQQEHCTKDLPSQRLAGSQVPDRHAPEHRSRALDCGRAE